MPAGAASPRCRAPMRSSSFTTRSYSPSASRAGRTRCISVLNCSRAERCSSPHPSCGTTLREDANRLGNDLLRMVEHQRRHGNCVRFLDTFDLNANLFAALAAVEMQEKLTRHAKLLRHDFGVSQEPVNLRCITPVQTGLSYPLAGHRKGSLCHSAATAVRGARQRCTVGGVSGCLEDSGPAEVSSSSRDSLSRWGLPKVTSMSWKLLLR